MLSRALLAAVALASGAVAESLFAVDFDIVASVVASKDGLTTYAVACPASSATSNCNFVQPYTLIQGPSSVSFAITVPNEQTATLQCTLPQSTHLSCSATAITPDPTVMTVVATSDFTGAGISSYYKDVSIVKDSTALLTYSPSVTVAPSGNKGANATSSGSFGRITSDVGSGRSGSAQSTSGVSANRGDESHVNAAGRVTGLSVVSGLIAVVAIAMLC